MKKNLRSWHVEKMEKISNGRLIEAVLRADFYCPHCSNNSPFEKPLVYDPKYGKQRVANELSAQHACPYCGIIFTLTKADQEALAQELEKANLYFPSK